MKSKNSNLWEGIVKRHPDGFGFLIPDDSRYPDVYIPSGKMGSALTNDRVRVLVHKKRKGGPRSHFGFIHSILQRHKEFAVGIWTLKHKGAVIRKHNLSCPSDITVRNPKNIPVEEGDYVKVKIHFDDKGIPFFKGTLHENFGQITSSAKDDIKRIMAEYNIPFDFPKEVIEEADKIPNEVREQDYRDRKDLRDKAFVTIDGATAKDFDDAIFIEKQDSFYRLYVAIADVSYYVHEDSFLDEEAFARGNSSYFPNFCSPMLPEKLSNNLCSLNPLVERLVIVQEMDFNFQGERFRAKVYPSVIKSQQRLTYGQAQDILDGLSSLKGDYIESLEHGKALAQILLKKHIKDQGLDLDIPETLVMLDDQGEPQDILKERRLFSHLMIEQFMLSANKAVSAFLEEHKIPLMYRVHSPPEKEKLQTLQKFSKLLGFTKAFQSRKNLVQFLSQYKNHEKTPLIHKLVLRSLPQACYSAFNKGHYGLNFSSYTHFTSPIRRYCDLLIHRLIKKALSKNYSLKQVKSKKRKAFNKSPEALLSLKEIEKLSLSISQKEQNSVKAERQIKDIKRARFLKKYVGQSFTGVVSSISSFGFFVTLKQFDVDGLVRFRDLQGLWLVDEFQLSARNKRTAYKIQFGEEVKILVTASNIVTGDIDFKLLKHKDRKILNTH